MTALDPAELAHLDAMRDAAAEAQAADWSRREPPPDYHDDPDADPDLQRIQFRERVAAKARELELIEEARRLLARQKRADHVRPRPVRLDEFLGRRYDTPTYRVAELWPTNGRVVLSAQYKAGKTTLVGNLLRSLVDGDPFLDRFPVTPGGKVVLIDNELDETLLHQWLTDQGIRNQAAVQLVALRGRVSTFDILDDDVRREWAQDIAGADIVLFDCLRPVLDALNLDENREIGRFLVPFDALLAESGALEAVVVHHMGHSGERSRGDSRIQDWPDAIWKLVRDKDDDDDQLDDPTGSRYFSAFGRGVDVRQAELRYDPANRHLHLGEHARNRAQAAELRRSMKSEEAVLAVVAAQPGIKKTELRTACGAYGVKHNPHIDAAVDRLAQVGLIRREFRGRSHLHYPGQEPL